MGNKSPCRFEERIPSMEFSALVDFFSTSQENSKIDKQNKPFWAAVYNQKSWDILKIWIKWVVQNPPAYLETLCLPII